MSLTQTLIDENISAYIEENFSVEESFLTELREEASAAGFPDISISSSQARFLQFLLRSIEARNVLEIGSLAGYSAIAMALMLPPDGKLTAIEIEPAHAQFIRRKVEEAGLEDIITVRNENAIDFLKTYKPDFALDFVFIDADKTSYLEYLKKTIPLLRKGGIIAIDNALAFGRIADEDDFGEDVQAIREVNQYLLTNKSLLTSLNPLGDGLVIGIKI